MATKQKMNKKYMVILSACMLMAASSAIYFATSDDIAERVRAKKFAKYIFNEIDEYVSSEVTDDYIEEFSDAYRKNPALINEYIEDLSEMSSGYARAIAKDAHFIKDFDKTITFDEAMRRFADENHNIVANKQQAEIVNKKLVAAKMGKKRATEK